MSLTPFQLRQKARRRVEAAALQLDHALLDEAWETVGYAIEFMLKARLCLANNLDNYPESKNDANELIKEGKFKKKDKLFTHDIDELLRLARSYEIDLQSYKEINWELLREWDVNHRYRPTNSFTKEKVKHYLEEAQSAIEKLTKLELFIYFTNVEINLSRIYGPFHCFALTTTNENKWTLLILYK